MNGAAPVALVFGGFLLGSIPFGVIVSRVFFHTDIRQTGSGNIGAANALRTLGKVGGTAVLLLDILKGAAPTLLATRIAPELEVFAATAAILGHCFSPWLRLKGGKGVATALGALIVLCWQAAVVSGLAYFALVRLTRYSSVASLIACVVSIPTLWLLTGDPGKIVFGIGATLFIAWKHRENIRRLREGRENRLFIG
jgi:acyl phosphate:glycerol-3-phosphate acyltransferase